jgi:hypothetical protein
MVIIFYTF